jgi:D-alanyl-D-alanine carboxypeptidase
MATGERYENRVAQRGRSSMMGGTNRPIRQARAIPVRRVRQVRPTRARRGWRTPAIAFLLSLLAVLSPDLTLAPLQAVEPRVGPRPIDEALLPVVPRTVPRLDDERVAGPVPPAPVELADAPRYQAALEAARTTASAYGITFAAVRDGTLLWAGSSGVARDGGGELTPTSELVIGSVTKTFVAAAILQLVAEGRLELDDSARAYLPTVRSLSPEITIAQLLDHTSGLADLFPDATRRGLEEHPEHAWTTDEVLRTLHEPWYEPGEGWAYANTNYFLLGLIVERLTGSSLTDELARRFLSPLGLGATHVLSPTDAAGPLEPAWTTIFWASGAMTASAADLARWGDALYGGELLGPDMRAAMLTMNDHDYGLGVQKMDIPGAVGVGHTGLLNTYTTLLYHLPAQDVTMALLVNRSHVDLFGMLMTEPEAGGPSLFELATGMKPPPPPEPSPSPSPSPRN